MASAEREPITGVWGQSPSGVQEQSPWWGVKGAKPPEAERVLAVGRPVEAARESWESFPSFYAFLNCKLQAVVY